MRQAPNIVLDNFNSNKYKYHPLTTSFTLTNSISFSSSLSKFPSQFYKTMGVVTLTDEHASPIPPARAFKALILNGDSLIPKLMPQAFKSIELIQGDGGVGSIKQINFAEGTPFKFAKHRVDEINEEVYKFSYTVIEGDVLMGKLEKICYEIELVASPDGGSITKSTSKYYPLGDFVINEEEVKVGQQKSGGMFKVVEDYLIQNPDAYA